MNCTEWNHFSGEKKTKKTSSTKKYINSMFPNGDDGMQSKNFFIKHKLHTQPNSKTIYIYIYIFFRIKRNVSKSFSDFIVKYQNPSHMWIINNYMQCVIKFFSLFMIQSYLKKYVIRLKQ